MRGLTLILGVGYRSFTLREVWAKVPVSYSTDSAAILHYTLLSMARLSLSNVETTKFLPEGF